MKVSDAEILKAIWRQQVKITAKGVVCSYASGRKGVEGKSSQHYVQDMHIVSRERLGIPLSGGHLRKRLIALIGTGDLCWSVHNCTFWRKNAIADEVFDYAVQWWTERGVPTGYDEVDKRMRTAHVDGFEGKVAQLEGELLVQFGSALS
ncbi:MAG: hypothetical protein ACRER3_05970 [Pseudomonas fluorescens]